MAVAAMSGIFSTAVIGVILLAVVALIVRSMWRKRKAGGCCGCNCSGCVHHCSAANANAADTNRKSADGQGRNK